MVLGIGVSAYNPSFMHLITHAVFKACLFLSAGAVIHTVHTQEMDRMGGLKDKLKITWFVMWCCTLAIAGVPFFSGFVSKDRILGDALLLALDNGAYLAPTLLGFAGAFLTPFYMGRMMFLVFHGTPKDKGLYEAAKKETVLWNKNVPLLILAVFTLGFWYSASPTGQGLLRFSEKRYEWFQTLITVPTASVFAEGSGEWREAIYDPDHGLSQDEAHHVHVVHRIGAVLSLLLALSGLFLAFLVYGRKKIPMGRWAKAFPRWYKVLKNKYFMDDFYIKGVIGRVLLPVTRRLSLFDMGFYDRFAVDGWAVVNRHASHFSRRFDDLLVDTALVDGTGASVRLFNIILRTLQSGKLQFYLAVIIFISAGYIWIIWP